jgi:Tol biopolymer transport system component
VDADWIPGTDALAVVRDPGGGRLRTVEFPVGKTVHEARAAWSLRVSPDGSRVAFLEGPAVFDAAPETMLTVIDKSGHKATLARGLTGLGLAWAPSGTEVWFTGTRPGEYAPHVRAITLSGVERVVERAPDWLVLHDISPEGRVLLARNTIHIAMMCKPTDDARERDLTWLVASRVLGLSPDGRTAIFSDPFLQNAASNPALFLRRLDGSPAVPIGEGDTGAWSPDGKWVLALSGGDLVLLPTGAGEKLTLPKGTVARIGGAGGRWLDSTRIVFAGDPGDNKPRVYVQEIPSGLPRPITTEGVGLAGRAAVRNDHSILGRVGGAWTLFSPEGGDGQPVPGLTARDNPLQWSHDGRYVYTVDNLGAARSADIDVFRVDLGTGERVLWKTLAPSDPVGVERLPATVAITPDAQAYCYSYMRRLGDLFVVDGLK